MTPKEQYEARKAERKARQRAKAHPQDSMALSEEQVMFLDMADRFVTAVERIADALDARTSQDKGEPSNG